MGSLHLKSSQQQGNEDKVFSFKQMVKKSLVATPTVYYQFMETIGEGSNSYVFKAKSLHTGELRVIKQVKKSDSPVPGRHLLNEYDILRQLDHPYIRKIYQMFQDSDKNYIVMEYLSGRDILQMLEQDKTMEEEMVFNIFYQTLLAVNYMHKNNVMHRDIKLQNIIYDEKDRCFKLIDFGSALRYTSPAPKERRCTGTINYMAPEVINKYYNMKCDIWSMGVMLYVLLSGNAPFASNTHQQILNKTLKEPLNFGKKIWEKRSSEVKHLVSRMLQKNFQKRPSAAELFKDPWVLKHIKKLELHKSQKEVLCNCLQKLIKFSKIKIANLQIGILGFMSCFLIKRQNQIAIIRSFLEIDLTYDGQLDQKDIKHALTEFLGMTPKTAEIAMKSIFDKLDIDKSGFINYSEFVMGAIDLRQILTLQNIKTVFSYIDVDNSKSISASELQSRLGSHLDEAQYAKFINIFDKDNNDEIDFQEFSMMMLSLVEKY